MTFFREGREGGKGVFGGFSTGEEGVFWRSQSHSQQQLGGPFDFPKVRNNPVWQQNSPCVVGLVCGCVRGYGCLCLQQNRQDRQNSHNWEFLPVIVSTIKKMSFLGVCFCQWCVCGSWGGVGCVCVLFLGERGGGVCCSWGCRGGGEGKGNKSH